MNDVRSSQGRGTNRSCRVIGAPEHPRLRRNLNCDSGAQFNVFQVFGSDWQQHSTSQAADRAIAHLLHAAAIARHTAKIGCGQAQFGKRLKGLDIRRASWPTMRKSRRQQARRQQKGDRNPDKHIPSRSHHFALLASPDAETHGFLSAQCISRAFWRHEQGPQADRGYNWVSVSCAGSKVCKGLRHLP